MEMELHDTIPAPPPDTIPAPPPAFAGARLRTATIAAAVDRPRPIGQWIAAAGAVALATMAATVLSEPLAGWMSPDDPRGLQARWARAAEEHDPEAPASAESQADRDFEAGATRPREDTDDLAADRSVAMAGQPRASDTPTPEPAPGRTLASANARRPQPRSGANEQLAPVSQDTRHAVAAHDITAVAPIVADVTRATEAARVAIPDVAVVVDRQPRGNARARGARRSRDPGQSSRHNRLGSFRTARGASAETRATPAVRSRRPVRVRRTRHELSASEIQAVVSDARARVQQCYDTALRREGDARAVRALLYIQIAPTGEVVRARSRGPAMGHLHACLEGAARRWVFPESRRGARVPIPLTLSPQR